MSNFAFKMSNLDRKLAIGEMVNPSDVNYDPQGDEFPDPLEHPEAAVQQFLQTVNSHRREADLSPEDLEEIDGFESSMMDFLHTCSDEKLGPDDLPGTKVIMSLFSTDDNKNGISTFGSIQKEAIIPALIAAGAALAPKLMPFVNKGLQQVGLGQVLGNLPIVGDLLGGGGGGGGEQQPPIQTTNYEVQSKTNNRFEMPYDHITDNLMFEAATSPGPKKRNEDIETLRSQVVAALKAWADSGEAENRAEWWVYFSYAHEASTIAELQTILTAVPSEFHNAVMTNPLPVGESPTPGDSGLPDVTNPAEGSESIATPSPVPIEGAGTPQKMPDGQGLIPGALSSHDKLKIRPIFANTDESVFENYAEEDRQVLAKVAQFIEAGIHEEEVIETLHPSYGLEKTIWAYEEATKVASNSPLVDPAVAFLGIEWKTANRDPYQAAREWLADLDFDDFVDNEDFEDSDVGYMDFNNLDQDQIKNVINELYEGGWNQFLKDGLHDDSHFPEKGEHQGQNEDQMTNQQETSGMITPGNEKVADYTAMPTPSPTINLNAGPTAPQQGLNAQVGLPPNPTQLTDAQKKEQEMMQLSQMYPNVPPEMAKNWLNAQKPVQQTQGHPKQLNVNTPAGQRANPQNATLPSATTAKVAAWKDTNGNLLERGRIYKMTSPQYPIPDFVRVINNGPDHLDLHMSEADVDISINQEAARTSKYKFEALEEKTSSVRKESYYFPGYHALVSVHNPETGQWTPTIAPNDQEGHIDMMYDAIGKNEDLNGANERLQSGNMYNDHTARAIYNPQTGELMHFSIPGQEKSDINEIRPQVQSFWEEQANQLALPVNKHTTFEEDVDPTQLEKKFMPAEIREMLDRASYLQRMRSRNRPLNEFERQQEREGITFYDTKTGGDMSKWNRVSKTASLSTFQQKELIDEQGVARNLDRLDLNGTHYPTLANFEQTATIEEESFTTEQFSVEDQELFL